MRKDSFAAADILRNTLLGAAGGAALGALALLFGLARFMLFVLSGGKAQTLGWVDIRPVAFYIGGFCLAGAFIGLVRPMLRGRVAVCAVMAIGGAIVMNTIAVSDAGIAGMHRIDWIAMTVAGALLGLAGAYGLLK